MTAREGRGLLSRLFGRKPAPPPPIIDRRDNSEDWRVGDLAVCINDNWTGYPSDAPVSGGIYRVASICEGVVHETNERVIALQFERWPRDAFATYSFRKIRPDAEPCEEEFTALIKRPVRPKVGA